ncbi:unnamed protein product, partial [marine sediment metagenome]
HTYGENKGTIGICVVGNYDETLIRQSLKEELFKLLDDIKSRYGEIEIHGHNEYSSKTCPGDHFPLGEIKYRYKNHWAEDFYDYYNDCIGTMHEKRFNDALTRGEYLALRCSEEQRKE